MIRYYLINNPYNTIIPTIYKIDHYHVYYFIDKPMHWRLSAFSPQELVTLKNINEVNANILEVLYG